MVARPIEFSRWAEDLTQVTNPLGKKTRGFDPGERPPGGHLNWPLNNHFTWTQYLDDERGYLRQSEAAVTSSLARIDEFTIAGPVIDQCHAAGNAAAVYEDVGNVGFVKNPPGAIFQRLTAGDTQITGVRNHLTYFVDENEWGDIYNAGLVASSVNPRWDVVEVTLVETLGVVSATWNVVQGVEAASPVEPATTAGAVKVAAILQTTVLVVLDPATDLRDYRVPLGLNSSVTNGRSGWSYDPAAFTESDGSIQRNAAAQAFAHNTGPLAAHNRLVIAGAGASVQNTPTVGFLELVRTASITTISSATVLADLTAGVLGVSLVYSEQNFLTGTPIWGNGYAAGFAAGRVTGGLTGSGSSRESLTLRLTAEQTTDKAAGTFWLYVGD